MSQERRDLLRREQREKALQEGNALGGVEISPPWEAKSKAARRQCPGQRYPQKVLEEGVLYCGVSVVKLRAASEAERAWGNRARSTLVDIARRRFWQACSGLRAAVFSSASAGRMDLRQLPLSNGTKIEALKR